MIFLNLSTFKINTYFVHLLRVSLCVHTSVWDPLELGLQALWFSPVCCRSTETQTVGLHDGAASTLNHSADSPELVGSDYNNLCKGCFASVNSLLSWYLLSHKFQLPPWQQNPYFPWPIHLAPCLASLVDITIYV